uniref:Uncharacterized protein n=1 Tax=Compsopogon caeruleus TaxID=31354 RepID=A0A7S1XDD6_9RHOD|mmetsp:Transcript_2080/g.3657  ORF Transcript_2080/g.3657 Transcript_2080/m.3657 type:complete len:116 (+) Transcript_2080:271-618(+)|eukprot:CAMPEP_0184686690 /NCGR_PEP_ID=MMETSP0312-20130426/23613_1 /TAXON_ID=31354 /ORGANISM="Compsopogon coeruleus, Strain SAG 36.94" /LENGTH=115 /DNA_ID=CAMNT_0027142065 /DNA_START=260 /DNA_END=607 /DNA_ORIENTATION=+
MTADTHVFEKSLSKLTIGPKETLESRRKHLREELRSFKERNARLAAEITRMLTEVQAAMDDTTDPFRVKNGPNLPIIYQEDQKSIKELASISNNNTELAASIAKMLSSIQQKLGN